MVWFDENRDGVREPGELPVAGVPVSLLDSTGTLIASTTTGADGTYRFDGLGVATFTVEVTPPAGTDLTTVGVGDPATDSDFVGPGVAVGKSAPIDLGPGENVTNIDAGLVAKVAGIQVSTTPPTLPFTGANSGSAAVVGGVLAAVGAVMLLLGRKKDDEEDSRHGSWNRG